MISALAAVVCGLQAKVRLPQILGNNMILQQNTEARLWGWAEPGKTVTVTTSWNTAVYTVKAANDGRWLVKVKTPAASCADTSPGTGCRPPPCTMLPPATARSRRRPMI